MLVLALMSFLLSKAQQDSVSIQGLPKVKVGNVGVNSCSWCWLLHSQGEFRGSRFFSCLVSHASLMYSSTRRLFSVYAHFKKESTSPHSSPGKELCPGRARRAGGCICCLQGNVSAFPSSAQHEKSDMLKVSKAGRAGWPLVSTHL